MTMTNRRGFTLPEVLVTIAIVATLAAVLLPALTSQISKGESTRVAEDLLSVQTAVTTFSSDIKRYPDSLSHLTTQLSGSPQTDILGDLYPNASLNKWKGPYFSKALNATNGFATGFGGTIDGDLLSAPFNGINYVAIVITDLSTTDFNKVDEIIDETASSTSGQFVLSGTDAVFYAVPIQ